VELSAHVESIIRDVWNASGLAASRSECGGNGRIPKVIGSEALLMQCVSNLLSNAQARRDSIRC